MYAIEQGIDIKKVKERQRYKVYGKLYPMLPKISEETEVMHHAMLNMRKGDSFLLPWEGFKICRRYCRIIKKGWYGFHYEIVRISELEFRVFRVV